MKAEIEKKEKKLQMAEMSPLYSYRHDKVVSYPQRVVEIYNEEEDLLYELAGNKGETIDSLSKKTLGQVLSFRDRTIKDRRGRH